jgi:hypothetical protein
VLALSLALAGQAAIGRVWPGAHRWFDLLLVPVAVFATSRSPRATLLVGCASGLLGDAWFQVGAFGATAFRRTALGWAIGLLASRFDLAHGPGRFAAGVALALGDSLLEPVVARLLDLRAGPQAFGEVLGLALTTGLVAAVAGAAADALPAPREPGRGALTRAR